MSFQKTVKVGGFETTFALTDDEATIVSTEASSTLNFDMLMTTTEREESLSGIASTNYMPKTAFLGLFEAREENEGAEELFTSESYDFMRYLNSLGLPPEISAQTAFLTDTLGDTTFEKRKDVFETFRNSFHAIKQVQIGRFTGLTTFIPYYMIAQWGGVKLATRASRKVDDDPKLLFGLMDGILKFRGGKIDDDVSDVQFDVLMDFMGDSFPDPSLPKAEKLSKFVMNLVLSEVNWTEAARFVATDLDKSTDTLDVKLVELVRSTLAPISRWGDQSVTTSVKNFIAVLKAKFGVEALTGAFHVLRLNSNSLTYRNSEHLIAYVAIADYLSSGGNTNESIDWMVSMEPALEVDEFFQRVLIDQA